jgi:type I restriction enzyme, S subunit
VSIARYPSYRASDSVWLGDLPDHWAVTSLKRLVDPERPVTYGIVQAGPHIVGGVPYIRPTDMTEEQGVTSVDDLLRTSPEIASSYSRSTVRTGDLVCSIGPSFGKVMVIPKCLDGANLTQGTARIACQAPHDARYLFWALRSPTSFAQWESSVGGATFRALNLGPLCETVLAVPPPEEQSLIAQFLDDETAKIDALIAEQQRLIELLQEKRHAMISQAVTKGLNPDAPMKRSNVEWLGDVPAHWTLKRFQRCVNIREGQVDPEDARYASLRLIAPNHVESGTGKLLSTDTAAEQGAESGKYLCYRGDIVYGKIRPALRKVVIAPWDCLCSADMYPLRAHSGLTNQFLLWMLLSDQFSNLSILESQRVAMPKINRESLKEILLPLPDLSEQELIVTELAKVCHAIDQLMAEASHAVVLLQERRSALISAAVTGKIDVRSLSNAQAA